MPQQSTSQNTAASKRVEFEGTTHEFPADATDEEVRKALSSYKPTGKAATSTPNTTPGFGERFRSSSGLPTSMSGVKTAGKMLISPFGPTARQVYTDTAKEYGRGLKEASATGTGEMVDAVRNIKAGGPVGANLGKYGYGLEHILASAFGPPGRAAESFGEDIHSNNYAGAAGTATGMATQATLSKVFENPPEDTPINKLAYATNADVQDLKTAFPDIKKSVEAAGNSTKTLIHLQSDVDHALRTVDNEFNTNFQPLRGQQYVPVEIYNDIRNQIKSHLFQTPAGRSIVTALNRRSQDFNHPWTLEDLNQERMDAYARLRSLRKAEAAGQRASLRTKADSMVDEAILKNTRDIIYSKMDQQYGKPAGYFADLKQRQSALLGVKDDLAEHTKDVTQKTAQQKGATFMERGKVGSYMHPTGGGGISLHRVHELFTNPTEQANKQIGSAFTTTKRAKANVGFRKLGQAGVASYPVRTLGQAARDRERRKGLTPLHDEDEDEQ